jgi:hypothetical protein
MNVIYQKGCTVHTVHLTNQVRKCTRHNELHMRIFGLDNNTHYDEGKGKRGEPDRQTDRQFAALSNRQLPVSTHFIYEGIVQSKLSGGRK